MGINSCRLHDVYEGCQTKVKATEFELNKILNLMWRFFNDSPTGRVLSIILNRSDYFDSCVG